MKLFFTMQEDAPSAPAQIMTSWILVPQYFLHSVLVRRGSATCCSLAGVWLAKKKGYKLVNVHYLSYNF